MRSLRIVPQLLAMTIATVIIYYIVRYFGEIDAVYLDDEVGYLAKATTLQEIPIRHPSKYHFGAGVFTVVAGLFFEFTSKSMSQLFMIVNIFALIVNLVLCNVLLRKLGVVNSYQRRIITFTAALGPASIPFIFSQFPNLILQSAVLVLCLLTTGLTNEFFGLSGRRLFIFACLITIVLSVAYLVHPSANIIAVGFFGGLIIHSVRMIWAGRVKNRAHFVKLISFLCALIIGFFYGLKIAKEILARSNTSLSNGYGVASDYSRVEDQIMNLLRSFDFPRSLFGTSGVLLAVFASVGPAVLNLIFKTRSKSEFSLLYPIDSEGDVTESAGTASSAPETSNAETSSLTEVFLLVTVLCFVAYGTTMVGSETGLARSDLYFYGRYVSALFPAIIVFTFRFRPKHVGVFVTSLACLIIVLYIGSTRFNNEWIIAPVNMVSFSPRVLLGARDLPVYYLALLGLCVGFFLLTRFRELNLYFLCFSTLISLVTTVQWIQFRSESAAAYSAAITDIEVIYEAYLGSEAFANGVPILFINRGGPDADLYRVLRSAGGRFEVDVISFAAPVETETYCNSPVLLVVNGVGTERFAEFVGFDVLFIDKYHRAALGSANGEACGTTDSGVQSELKSLGLEDFILEG